MSFLLACAAVDLAIWAGCVLLVGQFVKREPQSELPPDA
jgi:hypothetical protein